MNTIEAMVAVAAIIVLVGMMVSLHMDSLHTLKGKQLTEKVDVELATAKDFEDNALGLGRSGNHSVRPYQRWFRE